MRLGITGQLAKTLCSTNPCESMIEIVRHTQRNVKRWQDGDMRKRWTAAGMLVAEQQFRRIIGYRDLAKLVIAIERTRPPHRSHHRHPERRRSPSPLPSDRSIHRGSPHEVPRRSGHPSRRPRPSTSRPRRRCSAPSASPGVVVLLTIVTLGLLLDRTGGAPSTARCATSPVPCSRRTRWRPPSRHLGPGGDAGPLIIVPVFVTRARPRAPRVRR